MEFYKYSDNPEVWDSSGHHYSSYDELVKAGGVGKIKTIQRSTATNFVGPVPQSVFIGPTQTTAKPQLPQIPTVQQIAQKINYQAPAPAPAPAPPTPKLTFDLGPRPGANFVGPQTPTQQVQEQKYQQVFQPSGVKPNLFESAVQATPRAAVSAFIQQPFSPTGTIQQKIFGNEPIIPIKRQIEDAKKVSPYAALAVAGLFALDAVPGVPGKKIPQELIERAVKELGEAEAKKLATEGGEALLRKTLSSPSLKPQLPVPIKKDSLYTTLKNSFKPIKGTDAETQNIWREFTNSKLAAKEAANTEAKGALSSIPGKTGILTKKEGKIGFQTILDRQKGIETPETAAIAKTFADLRAEYMAKGLKIPDLGPNYVPQMYKNKTEEVIAAVAKYLKDKGVPPEVVDDYLAGKELPEQFSNALPKTPGFSKERVLPDYATAIKYGLAPRYTHPAQLAAAYRETAENALINQKLISDLVTQGKLVPNKQVGYSVVDIPGLDQPMYAKNSLANALNGVFRDEMNLGLGERILQGGATASRKMQEIVLSAGIPRTNANWFSTSVLIKDLTQRTGQLVTHPIKALAGAARDVANFVRANVDSQSIKWFENKAPMIQKMTAGTDKVQGIDLSSRIGNFRNMYDNAVAKKSWGEFFGDGWEKAWNKKTFSSYMPQRYITHFEEAYKGALKKGLSEKEAVEVGLSVTKNLDGLVDDLARSQGMQDGLSTFFFAPKFRESVIGSLFNAGRSVFDPRTWGNKAFTSSRQLATGIALTYGLYQGLNQKMNGHPTWENEPGNENNLRIPLPNGKVLFIPFMPSFMSMPRNIFTAGKALVDLDAKTFTKSIGSFGSMPIQIISQFFNNRDYFGNEIYKETDDKETRLKKYAIFFGLKSNHPWLKIAGNALENKLEPEKQFRKPGVQSILEALEIPAKIETMDRLSRNEFYTAIDKKAQENADAKKKVQPIYDQVQQLKDAGNEYEAQAIVDGLSEEDYAVYKTIKASGKRSDTIATESKLFKTYQYVQELKSQGNLDEVQKIVDAMSDDEYHAYTLLKNRFGAE